MTKKEFLESEAFKMLPEDGEIVFSTDAKIRRCVKLNELNLSVVKEDGKTALLIDAIPYWYLKEKYCVNLTE